MITKIFATIDWLVEALIAFIFAAIIIVGFMQVFNRYALNNPLSWSEEFQKFGHVWIVFLAIPVAYRRGAHMYMDVFRKRLPPVAGRIFTLGIELLWLGFGIALVVLTMRVAGIAARQTSPGLHIPMSYPYYGLVVGGAYLALVSVRRIATSFGILQPEAAK